MKDLRLILASTSTVHGSGYLEYLTDELHEHFMDVSTITFVPFARPGGITHEEYTAHARKYFNKLGKKVQGIHSMEKTQVLESEAIFVGGGNSFVLLDTLQKTGLLDTIKNLALSGAPYLGTSAGANIAGSSIMTTNDMPIIFPQSFDALNLLPIQINPHYQDPAKGSKHMGETRETRIKEYHIYNSLPVLGIREGAFVHMQNGKLVSGGTHSIRLFEQGKEPRELGEEADLNFLL